jgi:hypothetical protein
MQPTRTPLNKDAKYTADRPFADPEKAASSLPTRLSPTWISAELINGPFLKAGGSPAEYRTGLDLAIARGGDRELTMMRWGMPPPRIGGRAAFLNWRSEEEMAR